MAARRGRPSTCPDVFDPHPDPKNFGGQVGWYRIKLTQPTGTPAGFSWGARFEQIRRVADVFLDGERIAVHTDPYAAFTVALPALADGRPHELVVRADNHKAKEPREVVELGRDDAPGQAGAARHPAHP